ncbi:MAG: M24 family metallopeptidase [Clostridiaceae bacterium]|nr:M24 family metallopeptidase [Clostridiaceae bacterium]MDY5016256.1 M24 family metallopeptidase [Eubacteriales bacterium]
MSRVCIPDYEYVERIKKAAKLVADAGLDVMIVNSTESDYADVRYFSNFWPLFERAGVAIAANGDAALMCGPESRIFAADRSHIQKIYPSLIYRESANPSYPEFQSSSYRDVFAGIGVHGDRIKIGISGYLTTTAVMMDALRADYPNAEIRVVDEIMVSLRQIKSENELACIAEGFRIVDLATKAVMNALRPGVTELAMVGIAQQCIYENGAEYEGLPMYVFSEKSTSHAISRPGYRVIEDGDIVQLNLSAKVDGYSPSIGIPVCVGKLTPEKRRYVEFCRDAHNWTERQLRAGILASSVAKGFYEFYKENGYEENFVYGPCHGTGLIEVEAPWMETSSDYLLQPNMTFQVDTFLSGPSYGMRWENGVVIREDHAQSFSAPFDTIYEL